MGMRAPWRTREAVRHARWAGRGKAGFTLVELMIVVSIIGLLLVIAAWNYAGWIGRHRVESFTRDLQAAVMDVRMSAVSDSTTHCFFLNTPGAQANLYATYYVNRDTNNNLICSGTGADAGGAVIMAGFPKNVVPGTVSTPATKYVLNNLEFKAGGVPVTEVDFSPRGMLVDTGGTLITGTQLPDGTWVPGIILKVDYPGECWFTGECADSTTDRKVYPDIDCVVITPTQVNVGLGRINPANNLWDGQHCDVK